jgi:hypothetical protein
MSNERTKRSSALVEKIAELLVPHLLTIVAQDQAEAGSNATLGTSAASPRVRDEVQAAFKAGKACNEKLRQRKVQAT